MSEQSDWFSSDQSLSLQSAWFTALPKQLPQPPPMRPIEIVPIEENQVQQL